MSKELKTRFFQATVESILLYGCESWALTTSLEKSLDGAYTRMLRKIYGVRWESHTTNAELYGSIPLVSSKIASRRMRLAGHCYRHQSYAPVSSSSGNPHMDGKTRDAPDKTMSLP